MVKHRPAGERLELTTETSLCPGCHGRAKRELDKVACSAGTTFHTWVCGICFGFGRIDRDIAREVWLDPSVKATS